MVPLSAASMEKGSEAAFCEVAGGSMRRKGELDARRCLEMAWMRLFFGDPRLLVIVVLFVELGEERALRKFGAEEDPLLVTVGCDGVVKRENFAGFTKPASLLSLDFLVGEVSRAGSKFSSSLSSYTSGAR